MKHLIVIKSGTWVGREVFFHGAVFTTPGEINLYAQDVYDLSISTDIQADNEGHHVIKITAPDWEMVAEVTTRAYQSIAAHKTVNIMRKNGYSPGTNALNLQLASYEQDAAQTRTCCGG